MFKSGVYAMLDSNLLIVVDHNLVDAMGFGW